MRKAPHKISGARWMMLAYLIAIVLLGWLLMLPVSLRPGVRLSFIDALFTAASAISVTGLTTVGAADTFNGFGTALLMIGFQLGGIGIMSREACTGCSSDSRSAYPRESSSCSIRTATTWPGWFIL
ncbi:hypothetical protein O9H85_10100 [Paenibacillus filicis]|uniref:Uncharacterized protein n=1 Tax=Paenibacillus gyeongsangnamensis TaxID=3388067 RepID=A0ABT4Q7E9_9BACL|nr:potassium transporter TrkG [Paenibacillus filicis]MCZ8512759.1 hypothetical protein [Paenibacillus filicis]